MAAPATTDKRIAPIPPTGLPMLRREERAPLNGVLVAGDVSEVVDVVGMLVSEEVTIFDVIPAVELAEVVTTAEVVLPLLVDLVPEEVDEEDVTLTVATPTEKEGDVAKISVMLPMLTASIV